jgi:hypothetical protein
MAQGCNLLLSERDFRQIQESAQQLRGAEITKFVQDVILHKVPGWENRLTETLSTPSHPAHKVAMAVALKNILGNEQFDTIDKERLARSLVTITKITPDILGLVHPAENYGPRANPVLGNLNHKTRGYAFAYEINATASLINGESKAGNARVTLHISPTDRVDMGIKLQASHSSINRHSVGLYNPKRGTVEADTFVVAPNGYSRGIDYKFSKTGRDSSIEESQLKGVFNAILLGEVHEFHFVANGTFRNTAKDGIARYNQELMKNELESRREHSHEEIEKFFSNEEKVSCGKPPEPGIFWHEHFQ